MPDIAPWCGRRGSPARRQRLPSSSTRCNSAPSEDLSRYPRDEAGDLAALEAEGCALAWLPTCRHMYPADEATTIALAGPAERWEGDARPGHFRGVATVCAKLFGQVRPDRAYFGEKDWQQLQVIKRMVADLLLPLEIVGVQTVREADGLALSSRNRFLDSDQRRFAPRLYVALMTAVETLVKGAPVDDALETARHTIGGRAFCRISGVGRWSNAATIADLTSPSSPRCRGATRFGAVDR